MQHPFAANLRSNFRMIASHVADTASVTAQIEASVLN